MSERRGTPGRVILLLLLASLGGACGEERPDPTTPVAPGGGVTIRPSVTRVPAGAGRCFCGPAPEDVTELWVPLARSAGSEARHLLDATGMAMPAGGDAATSAWFHEVMPGWRYRLAVDYPANVEAPTVQLVELDHLTARVEELGLKRSLALSIMRQGHQPVRTDDGRREFEFRAGRDSGGIAVVCLGPAAAACEATLSTRHEGLRRLREGVTEDFQYQPTRVLYESRPGCTIPAPGRLEWSVRIDDHVTDLALGVTVMPERDGTFPAVRATVTVSAGGDDVLWSRELAPERSIEQCGWQDLKVPIDEWAGQDVVLTCAAEPLVEDTYPLVAFSQPLLLAAGPEDAPPSVLLISVDTLRPDHLGTYGYPIPTSPNLDRLASRSVVFERALSASTYTLPSHATMLSGQHPLYHQVTREPMRAASARTTFLAEMLRDRGYVTGAFTGGGFLSRSFGFGRGFDQYGEFDLLMSERSVRLEDIPVPGDREFNEAYRPHHRIGKALDWIHAHRDRPFFLFLHTFLVHGYDPTGEALDVVDPGRVRSGGLEVIPPTTLGVAQRDARPRDPKDMDALRALYDGTVRMLDDELGPFFDSLEEEGLLDGMLVMLTSDHGEEFGEHLGLGHGRTVYEETIRVPLIVKRPGAQRPARISAPVWLMDLVPTVMELAGVSEATSRIHGHSLLPLMRGEDWPERTVLVENQGIDQFLRYAVRTRREKFIWNAFRGESGDGPQYEWFDLTQDLGEQRPLVDGIPEDQVRRRADVLRRLIEQFQAEAGAGDQPLELDPALAQELEALGYAVGDS